jgi:hypothetical protein
MRHLLEPDRLASSLFLFSPDEAYEIALDFLNDALLVQDRERAMTWTAALTLIEKMQSDYADQRDHLFEMRSSSMM